MYKDKVDKELEEMEKELDKELEEMEKEVDKEMEEEVDQEVEEVASCPVPARGAPPVCV